MLQEELILIHEDVKLVELLQIENMKKFLTVAGRKRSRWGWFLRAVDGINLKIAQGEVLGLVGNPYSGVNIVGLSIMRSFFLTLGRILFQGENLGEKSKTEMEEIQKRGIFMMFSSFQYPFRPPLVEDPGHPLEMNLPLSSVTLEKIATYDPRLLVADTSISPNSNVREKILSTMKKRKKETKTSALLITQDLGAVQRTCDRIAVMYAGKIVEHAKVQTFLHKPLHPYSQSWMVYEMFMDFSDVQKLPNALFSELKITLSYSTRPTLADMAIDLTRPPPGCHFHTRCPYAEEICRKEEPPLEDVGDGRFVACHLR